MDEEHKLEEKRSNTLIIWLLYTIASAGICVMLSRLPALTLVLAIAWGVLIILAGISMRPRALMFMAVINGLVLYWQVGWGGVAVYVALFGAAAYVMALLVALGYGYYQVRTWGMVSVVISISLFLGGLYVYQGSIGIDEMEKQINQAFEENMKIMDSSGVLDLYTQQGISKEEMKTAFQDMAHGLARHLPAVYYLQGIVAVFFILLIASNLSLRRKIDRLIRRPYKREMMPWPLVWVIIAGLSLWLWGFGQKNIYYYAGSNILTVMVPLTCYYGLATLIFKLGEMKTSTRRWAISILIIVSAVFLPSAIIFLALSGMFDSLLDFRKLRSGMEE